MVLGKRARRSTRLDQTTTEDVVEAPPKRSRARRSDATEDVPLPRNGLLTPEPSALTESRTPPTLDAKAEATAEEDTYDPKTTFPFMKLPAELRLHVYHMALVRPSPLNLSIARAPDPSTSTSTSTSSSSAEDSAWPSVPASSLQLERTSVLSRRPTRTSTSTTPTTTPRLLAPVYPSDPVLPILLRLSSQIHKEARQLLYAENTFTLSLSSGIHTLSTLHQRSRSLIKHVVLTIPSHHDILDGFADLVRLGLRYCWGLKSFRIILHATLPDDGRVSGATSVYANAFHILRWLPRGCSVVLEGCVSETVRRVVVEEGRLMNVLDEVC